MKSKWLVIFLTLLLLCAGTSLQAQQSAASFSTTKAQAEKGDAAAQCKMGFYYERGEGVAKNVAEAVRWYRKAADQGFAGAQVQLGVMYEDGDGVAKDEVEAFRLYRKAAEQGVAPAQFNLSRMYSFGIGVAKDEVEGARWCRKAAEQGDALGQSGLGWKYANGEGVAKDTVDAVKWYRKAAEQNDATAQFALGNCYANGEGVAKDSEEALKWYRKAAEQNHVGAQCNLGVCYANGIGVAKDRAEAVKWWRKAADQGDDTAQRDIGGCYYDGNGMQKDVAEAAKWWRKAANQGNSLAQLQLGLAYETGEGVPKNYVEAYKLYNLSAANFLMATDMERRGLEPASKLRDRLIHQMTADQIAEAQRLSAAFVPHKETPGSSFENLVSPADPSFSGTGFFITDDGYLISNYHVVKAAAQIRLVTSAGLISAKVVKVDAANDLALLKAEGKFSPLPVASSRSVKLGATVATVGFPNIGLQGFAPKLAKGEIASLSGAGDDARYFQISVPVQPGNSGGALVDERGNVVGVVSAKLSARAALAASGALLENVNYAVKSSFLLGFLESVPEVAAKLKEPETKERKFEDVVKSAEQAAVLVLVY